MKLEKIVVNGFKSFADKTEFSFRQQITGIVGPNACNVEDNTPRTGVVSSKGIIIITIIQ